MEVQTNVLPYSAPRSFSPKRDSRNPHSRTARSLIPTEIQTFGAVQGRRRGVDRTDGRSGPHGRASGSNQVESRRESLFDRFLVAIHLRKPPQQVNPTPTQLATQSAWGPNANNRPTARQARASVAPSHGHRSHF